MDWIFLRALRATVSVLLPYTKLYVYMRKIVLCDKKLSGIISVYSLAILE